MLRNQIPAAAGVSAREMAPICGQMDVLLDKFLEFGAKNAHYRSYLVEMVRPAPGPIQTGAPWLDRLVDLAGTILNEKQDVVRIPVGGTPRRVTDVAAIIEEIRKDQDARIEQIQASMDTQTSEANRQVMSKNLEVLKKRRERIGELGDVITNLECQLDLIDSTFGLISDQVRTQAPEQILRDINDVVTQTETTTKLLAESAAMEQSLNRLDRTLA
jgi:acylphosphatase